MKKIYLSLLFTIILSYGVKSQIIPKDIIERVNQAEFIFEGEVIRSDGYWNDEENYIYTSLTIDILKTFKGNLLCGKVELITEGGEVGDSIALRISHNLELSKGEKGIFLCRRTDKEVPLVDFYNENNFEKLETVYNEQGFIKYYNDGINKEVVDIQFSLDSLAQAYDLMELYTQLNYVDCYPNQSVFHSDFKVQERQSSNGTSLLESEEILDNNYFLESYFGPQNTQHASGAIDTTLTLTLLNPQFSASAGRKYFSFDLGLSDSTNSIYFVQANPKIKFDTLTFGKRLKLTNRVWVTRSTLLQDTITFKEPTVSDNSDDGFTIVITANNPSQFAVNYPDLGVVPIPAVHVKMEIYDCLQFSTVDLVGINSVFTGYTDHPQTGPFTLVHYDTTNISPPLSFLGCDVLYIDSISPSIANAGVGDIITIYGDGFGGPPRGNGNVFLRNADYAGNVFLHLDSLDYINWTNTQIKFTLPSIIDSLSTHNGKRKGTPGTGMIAIKNDGGDSLISPSDTLTITYGILNFLYQNLKSKHVVNLTPLDSSTMKREFNFRPDKSFSNFPDRLACLEEAIKQWVCLTTVNFKLGNDTLYLDSIALEDNVNIVSFGYSQDTSVLAYTSTWINYTVSPCDKAYVREVDITVNRNLIPEFFADTNRLNSVPAGKYDLYQILLHELGHAHSLTHVNDTLALMYRSSSNRGIAANLRGIRLINDQSAIAGGTYIMDRSRAIDTVNCNVHVMDLGTQHCVGVIGISELDFALSNMSVFPNPTDENINVVFDLAHRAKINISIFDLYGRNYFDEIKMIEPGVFKKELIMNNFASGIYLLRINAGNSSSVRKIIKQ